MRISIQACIEGEGSQPSKVIKVGFVERQDSFAPAAGLGLFMRETHALLKKLQTVVLDEQVDRFVAPGALPSYSDVVRMSALRGTGRGHGPQGEKFATASVG